MPSLAFSLTHSLTHLPFYWLDFSVPVERHSIDAFNAQAAALNIQGEDGQLCTMEEDHNGKTLVINKSAPH